MRSINFIHLSDLHIDIKSYPEIISISNALCEKILQYREENEIEKLDLLILSGDLINKGSDSYDRVMEIINNISKAAAINKNQIFFVPGNHDVDREKCTSPLYANVIDSLKKNPDNFFEIINDQASISLLKPQFEKYKIFSEAFPLLKNTILSFEVPGFVLSRYQIGQLDIRLCGLNTALVAGPKDNKDGHIPLTDSDLKDRCSGFSYLSRMLHENKTFNKDSLNIIVSHYPLSWIHEMERKKVEELLQQKTSILLTGHIHEESADTSGLTNNQLLQLGVGSAHSKKWDGRYHCRIIEFKPGQANAFLHDWIWSSQLGWRAFEPLKMQCTAWEKCCKKFDCFSIETNTNDIKLITKKAGLVDIQNNRSEGDRDNYYERVIANTAPNSELIIVGRSLTDWSKYYKKLENAINVKEIHVKLGLLDENTIPNKNSKINSTNLSWIEKPIPEDWAMVDVTNSMEKFRKISVSKTCKGSLEIYGLPFYTSHSFVAYQNIRDNMIYCSEEAGMGLQAGTRPFYETKSNPGINSHLQSSNPVTYTEGLRKIYFSMLTPDRLLIKVDGIEKKERTTTDRTKIIGHKIERLGLVDVTVGRDTIDWLDHNLAGILKKVPEKGEMFMVGRSLVTWDNHQMSDLLISTIIKKRIQCNLVIADPSMANLSSLVEDDYAIEDLERWERLQKKFHKQLKMNPDKTSGYLEIFGIPAYLPVSFASYCINHKDRIIRYCSIEPGISVVPAERPIIYFRETKDTKIEKIGSVNPKDYDGDDIYHKLNRIYRKIIFDDTISERTKLLFSSKRTFKNLKKPVEGNAIVEGKKKNRYGWFVGNFLEPFESLCHTSEVEIKWGIHCAGDSRTKSSLSNFSSTLTLLIDGKFVVNFPEKGKEIELSKPGDYVIYPPDTLHTWRVIEDCVVLTVRWPSIQKKN